MIEWRDQGVLLAVRKHGETSVIVEVFTPTQGRAAGIVRGGAGRRLGPILQPGVQLDVEWKARLEAHLGSFTVEPVRSRAALVVCATRDAEQEDVLGALPSAARGPSAQVENNVKDPAGWRQSENAELHEHGVLLACCESQVTASPAVVRGILFCFGGGQRCSRAIPQGAYAGITHLQGKLPRCRVQPAALLARNVPKPPPRRRT